MKEMRFPFHLGAIDLSIEIKGMQKNGLKDEGKIPHCVWRRVNKKMYKLAILTITMLLTCCVHICCPVTYGYKYVQTTGITQFIVTADGDEMPIRFSSSSDQEALDALRGLKWNVLIPNANGVNMSVIGILDENIRHTPGGPYRAVNEKYQEFELHSWHIAVPFQRQYWKDGVEGPDGTLLLDQKMHLDANDFKKKIDGDLSMFEKTTRNN